MGDAVTALREAIYMLLSSPTNSQEAPVDKVTSVRPPACRPRLSTDQTRNSREQVKSVFLIIAVNDDLRFLSDVIKIPRVTCTDKTEGEKKRSLASPLEQDEGLSAVAAVSDNISTSRRKLSNIRMKCYFSAFPVPFAGVDENIWLWRIFKRMPAPSNDAQVSGCQWS